MSDEKLINDLVKAIKSKVKLDSVAVGTEDSFGVKDWVSTGVMALDWVMGGKGLPCGRLISVYGDFSSGKSWFVYKVLSKAQKLGMIALLLETEGSYSPDFVQSVGVDVNKLIVAKPDSVEQAFQVIDTVIQSSSLPVAIGWDSIAATPTEHELQEGMDVRDMTKPNKIGQGLRILTNRVEKMNSLFVITNQVREKIGVMFGDKTFTPGGRAMEFHASLMLRFNKREKITNDAKQVIGQVLRIECTKSKICVPFRWVDLDYLFDTPIDVWTGMLGLLKRLGYVINDRGWNTLVGDNKKWRDSEFEEVLIEKKEYLDKVLSEMFGGM